MPFVIPKLVTAQLGVKSSKPLIKLVFGVKHSTALQIAIHMKGVVFLFYVEAAGQANVQDEALHITANRFTHDWSGIFISHRSPW